MTYRSPFLRRFFFNAVFMTVVATTYGQAQPQLNGLPSAAQVMKLVKGSDARETISKQYAILYILWDMIALHSLDTYHSRDSRKETDLKTDYNSGMAKLSALYDKTIERLDTDEKRKAFKAHAVSLVNDDLRNEIVQTLFNRVARDKYFEIKKTDSLRMVARNRQYAEQRLLQEQQLAEAKAAEERKKSGFTKKIAGFGLLVLPAIIFGFWKGKRRFSRTNSSGVEEFSSYGRLVSSRLFESIAGLVVGVLMIIGVMLMIGFWN